MTSGGNSRRDRVAQTLRMLLAEMIEREVRDPRVHAAGLVSVNLVELNRDMSVARVYVSFLGGDTSERAMDRALAGLQAASGFLRGPIARRMGIRRAPELRFARDTRAEFGQRIQEILDADEARGGASGPVPGDPRGGAGDGGPGIDPAEPMAAVDDTEPVGAGDDGPDIDPERGQGSGGVDGRGDD